MNLAKSIAISKLKDMGKLPLFLAISGSHAHGLATPNSDIDVRGVYLDPTKKVLSLHRGADTVQFTYGDVDFQGYELGKFLSMLLNNNGNMVRLLLSPICLYEHPDIPWRNLGHKFITKKLRHYYRGYAESQRKRSLSQRGGKALIYTYREMFEGLSVMRLGEPIFNFIELWRWVEDQGFYTDGLLYRYYGHTDRRVTDEGWKQFYTEWDRLCQILDEETRKSNLPDSYDGYEECNNLLLKFRLGLGLRWPDTR